MVSIRKKKASPIPVWLNLADGMMYPSFPPAQPSSSTISPVQLYQFPTHMQQNGQQYFSMSPYNMLPYGQAAAAWTQQQNLPLSSYSTLNGATTSISNSEQQQQQQQSSPQQQQNSPPAPPTPTLAIECVDPFFTCILILTLHCSHKALH